MSGPVRITMNRFNAWIDGLFPPAITEARVSPEVLALRAEVEQLKAAHAAFAASRTAYLESLDRKIGVCRASLATALDRIVTMDVAATAAEHKAAGLQRANALLSTAFAKITADARQRADHRNLTARLRTAKAKATLGASPKPRKRPTPSA